VLTRRRLMFLPDAGVGVSFSTFFFEVVDRTVNHEACEKLLRKVGSVGGELL